MSKCPDCGEEFYAEPEDTHTFADCVDLLKQQLQEAKTTILELVDVYKAVLESQVYEAQAHIREIEASDDTNSYAWCGICHAPLQAVRPGKHSDCEWVKREEEA